MKLFWIIAAMVLLLTVVVIGVLPKFTEIHKYDQGTAAVQTLRSIHNSQAQFRESKGRFGALKELAGMGLIPPRILQGIPISGYIYSEANVSADAYCIRAKPANDKVGTREFNIIEDGQVRYQEVKMGNTVACGEGISLTSDSR
jgi:hypothetical protein